MRRYLHDLQQVGLVCGKGNRSISVNWRSFENSLKTILMLGSQVRGRKRRLIKISILRGKEKNTVDHYDAIFRTTTPSFPTIERRLTLQSLPNDVMPMLGNPVGS
jgi:hypothetical protein